MVQNDRSKQYFPAVASPAVYSLQTTAVPLLKLSGWNFCNLDTLTFHYEVYLCIYVNPVYLLVFQNVHTGRLKQMHTYAHPKTKNEKNKKKPVDC